MGAGSGKVTHGMQPTRPRWTYTTNRCRTVNKDKSYLLYQLQYRQLGAMTSCKYLKGSKGLVCSTIQ